MEVKDKVLSVAKNQWPDKTWRVTSTGVVWCLEGDKVFDPLCHWDDLMPLLSMYEFKTWHAHSGQIGMGTPEYHLHLEVYRDGNGPMKYFGTSIDLESEAHEQAEFRRLGVEALYQLMCEES